MTRPSVPANIETERLLLRKPEIGDAQAVFENYASDPVVTRYMSWPMHNHLSVTEEVVELWVEQWRKFACGAFLIIDKTDRTIIGSTGLDLVNPQTASTGYVLMQDHWRNGYATEALKAIVKTAAAAGIQRLFAHCHHEHQPSARVLEKGGFEMEGRLRNYMEFPNLTPGRLTDVLLYAWIPHPGLSSDEF